jgi:VWFA-related protein
MELDALVYPIRYDTYQDVQAMKDRSVIVNKPTVNGPIPGKASIPIPVSVPGVVTGNDRGTSAEEYRRAEEYLNQLALRTGGRIYLADSFGNLNSAFSKIASELREYYSLGFYPADDTESGRLRKIKVRVDKPDVAVKARGSYVLGKKAKGR